MLLLLSYLDDRIQFIGTSLIINAILSAARLGLLGLDLDEHILGIAPVRHRIRIGIIDRWIPREVGGVHGREDVVRHERGNGHLLCGELAELAVPRSTPFGSSKEIFWMFFDDLVEFRVLPAHAVAACSVLAARHVEL